MWLNINILTWKMDQKTIRGHQCVTAASHRLDWRTQFSINTYEYVINAIFSRKKWEKLEKPFFSYYSSSERRLCRKENSKVLIFSNQFSKWFYVRFVWAMMINRLLHSSVVIFFIAFVLYAIVLDNIHVRFAEKIWMRFVSYTVRISISQEALYIYLYWPCKSFCSHRNVEEWIRSLEKRK